MNFILTKRSTKFFIFITSHVIWCYPCFQSCASLLSFSPTTQVLDPLLCPSMHDFYLVIVYRERTRFILRIFILRLNTPLSLLNWTHILWKLGGKREAIKDRHGSNCYTLSLHDPHLTHSTSTSSSKVDAHQAKYIDHIHFFSKHYVERHHKYIRV
jgi:hypothetical protein